MPNYMNEAALSQLEMLTIEFNTKYIKLYYVHYIGRHSKSVLVKYMYSI